MTIIDRYIGRQVLSTSIFAVAVLSFVLVLGNIFRKLFELVINRALPLEFILSFIGYVLPFSLTFTIPWGFLTAILLLFGRLSAENELTAFRANGVAVTRLCVPIMVLAVVFTLLCLWINLEVAPRAQERMKAALFNIATSNPIALFGSDSVIEDFPGRKIYVGRKSGNDLEDVLVFEVNERDVPMRVIHAHRGRLEVEDLPPPTGNATLTGDPGEKQVRLRLFDARFEQRDDADPGDLRKMSHGITMEEGVIAISLKELYEKNRKRRGLGAMPVEELIRALSEMPAGPEATAARTEVSKRFSFSLACIAFALIAVPFGIVAQRRETSIGFGFSILIGFVYFLFIPLADTFRHNPAAHPELLIWLPNVLFISLGAFLFVRMARR